MLPAEVGRRIDWATLQLMPGTFVDAQLGELRTDLLFSARMDGREVRLYLLLEHQSTVDPRMPLRLLEYMVRIWAAHERDHPKAVRLPPIVPCVVYANEGGWTAPVAFEDLLDLGPDALEHLRPYLPSFSFLLDELTPERDEDLRQRVMTALGQLTLHLLRRARPRADLTLDLQNWSEVMLTVLQSANGMEALTSVLRYALEVSETPLENVHQLARTLGPHAEQALMTGAQILIDQGRAEGEASLLLRLLERKFGAVPVEIDALVRNATLDQLDVWAERLLGAATLNDIFVP